MDTNQKMTAEDFRLPPDPERIVNGLRDTGYNFNTAIADIVDNSISANATVVNIDVNLEVDAKEAIFLPGVEFNIKLKRLAGDDTTTSDPEEKFIDQNIIAFKRRSASDRGTSFTPILNIIRL